MATGAKNPVNASDLGPGLKAAVDDLLGPPSESA